MEPSSHGTFDPLQLSKMEQIVPGVQSHQTIQALLSAFAMQTHTLKIACREPFEQTDVCASLRCKANDSLLWFRVTVAEAIGPEILVVALQLGAIMCQHHAKPVATDQFRIGEVLQDLVH
jgi:hypothetical protein